MYIQKISIKNYRCFQDFSMEFRKGLNVIIGANNSGKTGLLYAIRLLNEPTLSVDDFNKSDLSKFSEKYLSDAPSIEVEYTIRHLISENDTEDESIIRLLPFLGMDKLNESRSQTDDDYQYNITAVIKTVCVLDSRALSDYRNAVSEVTDLNGFILVLKSFISKYSWSYYNGASDTEATRKDATGIFDIRFIGAERSNDAVSKETRREIEAFAKEQSNTVMLAHLRDDVSEQMKKLLKPVLDKLSTLFENENNDIGLSRGHVSISHDIRPNVSIGDSYVTEVRDTDSEYIIPLDYNGLGYNNLISIYMLVKLTEIQKGRDFRILCLEEPEAHLHPAMQYKLFKYLRKLDDTNELNQQIFVTTHSSNITAVAGIDNMYMLDYVRSGDSSICKQQSLAELFPNETLPDESNTSGKVDGIDETGIADEADASDKAATQELVEIANKQKAKNHLSKFLDVTRSDMLFADKVILVEGIAERLLLPLIMAKCGCTYEDEHISIVEIGGKHFGHFVELFNGNAVKKKVLCITDKDFKWITETDGKIALSLYSDYIDYAPPHIKQLNARFQIENFRVVTQNEGGKTFEDELFIANMRTDTSDITMASKLLSLVATDTIQKLINDHDFRFNSWDSNRPKGKNSVVSKYLDAFKIAMSEDPDSRQFYERLFFAELFLYYASTEKGAVALNILTDASIAQGLEVPQYMQEGLKWLLT